MKLVIISGMAATGKTTLARRLSERLGYEFYSKDSIKEELFDARPHSTWRYTWYEKQAKMILFDKIEQSVRKKQSVVVETNFIPVDRRRLRAVLKGTRVTVVEIYCYAKGLTYFRRFVKRNESGNRHRGHHDRALAYGPVFLQAAWSYTGVRWSNRPLMLSRHVKLLNTNDPANLDYDDLIKFIKKAKG